MLNDTTKVISALIPNDDNEDESYPHIPIPDNPSEQGTPETTQTPEPHPHWMAWIPVPTFKNPRGGPVMTQVDNAVQESKEVAEHVKKH